MLKTRKSLNDGDRLLKLFLCHNYTEIFRIHKSNAVQFIILGKKQVNLFQMNVFNGNENCYKTSCRILFF